MGAQNEDYDDWDLASNRGALSVTGISHDLKSGLHGEYGCGCRATLERGP